MKANRIAPLLAGIFINLFAGLIYAWSLFVAPLEADLGWNRTETSGIFTVSMICFCLGNIVAGLILKKKSTRFAVIVAALMMTVGFIWASTTQVLITIYIAYGVLCGTGVGIVYNGVLSTVVKWFPEKPGTISGIILISFGAGGMILGSTASALMTALGWRETFVILGILFAIIFGIGAIWLKTPGPGVILPEPIVKKKKEGQSIDVSTRDMMKTRSFWAFLIWATLVASSGLVIIGHASTCVLDMGASMFFATVVTSTISVANGCGRLLSGYIYDKKGYKTGFFLLNTYYFVSFVIFTIAIYIESPVLFLIGAAIVPFGYGGSGASASAFTNDFFGPKNYSLNLSMVLLHMVPAALLGPLVAGAIETATGSYLPVMLLFLGITAVAYFVRIFIKKEEA